jgi:putative ABC transport system permease protein
MPSSPIAIELADSIRSLGDVESVEVFRTIPIRLGTIPAFLQGVDVEERLQHGGLSMVKGDLRIAARPLVEGSGVLLSENLAFKMRVDVGDVIAVPTPDGPRTFKVEGTYRDYLGSLDLGAVLVEQRFLSSIWRDRNANLLRVWLKEGVNHTAASRAVAARLSNRGLGDFFVLEAGQFVDSIRTVIRQFFAATWALEIVAALVGVIGVVNTQLAIVLDRASEIGVLRTIGLSRKDIIRSVVIECGALGALGGILGVILGIILGAQIVLVSLKLVTGWTMAFHVPWLQLVVAIVIATGISALAGYVPARAAARVRLGQTSAD